MTNRHHLRLLLIIMCTLPYLNHTREINKPYYQLIPVNNYVGLYYNQLGNAKLSNSQYTLLTYLNLTAVNQKYDQLLQLFTRSLNICTHGTKQNFCQNSLQSLQARISAIKDKIETIKHMTSNESDERRKIIKRGLFNGASYVSHWLFGTPDAEDAKFYKETIDSIIFDYRNVQLLMKRQIAIISNTVQNFNSSIQNLQTEEDKFNENIKLLNSFSNSTINYLNDIFARHLILEQLFSLSQISSELDEKYNLIISSIMLARHSILHQQVVSPLNLLNEMSKVVLQNGLKWPIPLTHSNIYKYDKLYKLEVNYINNIVIFAIRIPLIEEMQYELYEMLPFPIRHNSSNIYSYIQPSFPYLMLSTNKVYYALLGNLEVCLPANTNESICFIKHVTRTTGRPTCETTIITSTTKTLPSSCQIHTIQADFETWYYIRSNEWIYIITYPSQLTLTCSPTHIEDVELKSAGIIRLEPQCKGYTEAIVLEPSQKVTVNRKNNLTISNIADDDCCPKNDDNLTLTPIQLTPIKITNVGTEDLKYTNHKLEQLGKLLEGELNKPITVQRSPWYTITLSVIISIVGIILAINLLRWCGILRWISKYLCFTKEPRSVTDTCCFKIFNTNINTGPVTRTQLSQILEEENRCRSEEREYDPRSVYSANERCRDGSPTRPISQHGFRRSASRAPSINMD